MQGGSRLSREARGPPGSRRAPRWQPARPRQQHSTPLHASGSAPAMVLTKMDSRVQAWGVMPTGMGTRKRSASPMPTAARNGTGLAPCSAAGGGVVARQQPHACTPPRAVATAHAPQLRTACPPPHSPARQVPQVPRARAWPRRSLLPRRALPLRARAERTAAAGRRRAAAAAPGPACIGNAHAHALACAPGGAGATRRPAPPKPSPHHKPAWNKCRWLPPHAAGCEGGQARPQGCAAQSHCSCSRAARGGGGPLRLEGCVRRDLGLRSPMCLLQAAIGAARA